MERSLDGIEQVEQGCVMANEVLDNLPVNIVERHDGEIRELYVDETDGVLRAVLGDPSTPEIEAYLERVGVKVPEGPRFEVGLEAETFARVTAEKIRWGAVVFVDYGDEAADSREANALGTLVCYSGSGTDDRPLERPERRTSPSTWTGPGSGRCFDARRPHLRRPRSAAGDPHHAGPQGPRHEASGRTSPSLADKRGVEAVRALSRRQGLGALADPGGLGGLQVMFGLKEMSPAPFIARSFAFAAATATGRSEARAEPCPPNARPPARPCRVARQCASSCARMDRPELPQRGGRVRAVNPCA